MEQQQNKTNNNNNNIIAPHYYAYAAATSSSTAAISSSATSLSRHLHLRPLPSCPSSPNSIVSKVNENELKKNRKGLLIKRKFVFIKNILIVLP